MRTGADPERWISHVARACDRDLNRLSAYFMRYGAAEISDPLNAEDPA
jgi:hypothetical protein